MFIRSKKLYAILVFLLYLAWGFVQERLKISMNFYIEQSSAIPGFYEQSAQWRSAKLEELKANANARHDYYWSHESINLFNDLSLSEMKMLKAVFAVFFILFSFIAALLVLKLWFGSAKVLFGLILCYSAILILLLLAGGIAFLFPKMSGWYAISRELLGIIQSPIPLMVVGLLFRFFVNNDSQSNKLQHDS